MHLFTLLFTLINTTENQPVPSDEVIKNLNMTLRFLNLASYDCSAYIFFDFQKDLHNANQLILNNISKLSINQEQEPLKLVLGYLSRTFSKTQESYNGNFKLISKDWFIYQFRCLILSLMDQNFLQALFEIKEEPFDLSTLSLIRLKNDFQSLSETLMVIVYRFYEANLSSERQKEMIFEEVWYFFERFLKHSIRQLPDILSSNDTYLRSLRIEIVTQVMDFTGLLMSLLCNKVISQVIES